MHVCANFGKRWYNYNYYCYVAMPCFYSSIEGTYQANFALVFTRDIQLVAICILIPEGRSILHATPLTDQSPLRTHHIKREESLVLHFWVFFVYQKPTNAEDTIPRHLLQPSPTVTEPPTVQRKRGLSSVSFLSDAMDGESFGILKEL